jgi:glycosyltransferase involved in cell wall biosynthesis
MKIGILGTRGIPNHHGGFEQFAEFFSVFLVQHGHEVFVYNSSNHPYQRNIFQGVNIIHCKDPENKIGTIGQFIYDYYCIQDSKTRNFDILLQLGYTSSSIWYKFLPSTPVIITNMDGLEWKRSKYSKLIRRFLKFAENLAVKSSDYLISDSIGIQNYLQSTYNVDSRFIAYGAELFKSQKSGLLNEYDVEPFKYNMLVARLEPENNIETILDGVVLSKSKSPFLVIGKHDVNTFGQYLKNKFKQNNNIKFIGGVYNLEHLNNLRYHSNLYFHGHSVGGTNPSLLEAMASNALIVAHNNEFNKHVIGEDGFYFNSSEDVSQLVKTIKKEEYINKIKNNEGKIISKYNWEKINKSYLDYFNECFNKNKSKG